jgi:hypothetical protein
MSDDPEQRLLDLEASNRRLTKEVQSLTDNFELCKRAIKALRLLIKSAPTRLNTSGEITKPVNDCQKCLGSNGEPTYHIFVDGAPVECECKAPWLQAMKLYRDQQATDARRKIRDDAAIRRLEREAKKSETKT